MIGQNGAQYWPEEDLPILTETVFPAVMAGGWSGEVRQKRKDGSLFDASATIHPLSDETGQITSMVVNIHDITERKQAEEEMRKLAMVVKHSMR